MEIKLTDKEKIRILNTDDIYTVMRSVLLREQKIDQDREHLWTISLDTNNKLLAIELVSLGSINATIVKPMEVFSLPLQKRAVQLIIVHNHPSGNLNPSEQDMDVTDNLIQVGLILQVPVIDHLIISKDGYFSFADDGLLEELKMSFKYVSHTRIKQMAVDEARGALENATKLEMAKAFKKEGADIEMIARVTGLDKPTIEKL